MTAEAKAPRENTRRRLVVKHPAISAYGVNRRSRPPCRYRLNLMVAWYIIFLNLGSGLNLIISGFMPSSLAAASRWAIATPLSMQLRYEVIGF